MGIEASRSTGSVKTAVQRKREQFRRLVCEGLEQRLLLASDGPRLLSIAPNAGEILSVTRDNVLNESPRELVFRFDSDVSKSTLAEGIRIYRSGGDNAFGGEISDLNPNADIRIIPSYLDFGESNRIVIARFSQNLDDDLYTVQVLGAGSSTPITNPAGEEMKPRIAGTTSDTYQFDLELGTKIIAVVPQPVVRQADGSLTQLRNVIEVYFNDDELFDLPASTGDTNSPAVVNPEFYKLINTRQTANPNDDFVAQPQSISYDPIAKKATLTFSQNIESIGGGAGEGTFRLRIGSNAAVATESVPINPVIQSSIPEPGSTLDLAAPINGTNGILNGAFSTILSQTISAGAPPLLLDFPGGNLEPGHRDIQDESHISSRDSGQGIGLRYYSFMDGQSYGVDVQGRPVYSIITPEQRARVREVFEFFSMQLGIDFIERTGDVRAGDLQIVVGDMNPHGVVSAPGDIAGIAGGTLAIMDGAEVWDNNFGYGANTGGGSFFDVAMHEIGHLLGFGHTYDLPSGTVMGQTGVFNRPGNILEQVFPSQNDLVHGQRLWRPDNRDVDLYRFVIPATQSGEVRIETIAERLDQSSNLDTYLTLLKREANGSLSIVSVNNNYFSDDSFINVELGAGEYFISVTGKGNEDANPLAPETGSGAVSQGSYQLRFDFKSTTVGHLAEQKSGSSALGSKLDGDSDGKAGGDFNFWFRAAAPYAAASAPSADGVARTLFVDKAYTGSQSVGSLAQPFKTISAATAVAQAGDIVRIVGDTRTPDNLLDDRAYEIGNGGSAIGVLSDGANLEVPRGVTLMIDAGTIFKFAGSGILVGSSDATTDRSNAAIQVLGTPDYPVYMTSYNDQTLGVDTNPLITSANPSDWGGIEIRNNFDRAQGRLDREREGIFLNTISNADIRFGGGLMGSGASAHAVSPIDLSEARPLILNNKISRSGSAAISADPNSFEETLFTEPRYQNGGAFVPDYSRVGPDIRSNTIANNSINGLFVRIDTTPTGGLQTLNVPARIDDTEITIVLGENLIIEGTPGGATSETVGPDISAVGLVAANGPAGQGFQAAGNIQYVMTYVDRFGQESLASNIRSVSVSPGQEVRFTNLPSTTLDYVSRRIYRRDTAAADFKLVATLNGYSLSFVDNNIPPSNVPLPHALGANEALRARRDASLVIDPGTVIKSQGGRIEVGVSATFLAEGTQSNPIIFTSRRDDRYGAGGTLDTNNDGSSFGVAGDWGGIISRHLGELSLDNTVVTFGGGTTRVPGGFASFNAIEIHQSTARIANSLIENNASGTGTASTTRRDGRGPNDEAAIFVVGSQPVIINNVIRHNAQGTGNATTSTAAISIDANSLNSLSVRDYGRSTGINARENIGIGNYGPLVANNQLGGNAINGMNVRGATLTTESIWDDTDIVHVLQTEIVIPDLHVYGGLRLTSRADESLVVKLKGATAGFTAGGRPLDINDRIGGSLQVIGSPGFPVVLTSWADDTIGAGFDYAGRPMVDTNNDSNLTSPVPGDWRSVRFEPFANDRNVEQLYERESDLLASTGSNDEPSKAENLGALAPTLSGGDENLRLGYTVTGSIATPADLDVYQFSATAGTQIWIDIDQTSSSLDSVVELVDASGQIIALSDNSLYESINGAVTYTNPALIGTGRVNPMDQEWNAPEYPNTGTDVDFLAKNQLDAGMRVVLPGATGSVNNYYIRVRSSNLSPVQTANGQPRNDVARLSNPANLRDGLTVGQYKLQVRLQQTQEYAGSGVKFADVRYATTGIEAIGLPFHSPLVGDYAEPNPAEVDNAFGTPQKLGNLLSTDRGSISVAGQFTGADNIDFYEIQVTRDSIQQVSSTPTANVSVVFDVDYADGLGRANTQLWIFDSQQRLVLTADDSNIQDDQGLFTSGGDASDLSRGSFGTRDAYIGPFELPQGTYYVAVSNKSQSHLTMRQFTDADAGGHQLVRVEPIDSIRRISEDRFDSYNRPTVALPAIQTSFDTSSPVAFNLSDVTLFAVTGRNVNFINPLTGVKEAIYSTNGTSAVNFGPNTNSLTDIAVAPNGHAIGFQQGTGTINDGNSGTFVGIDIGNGAPTAVTSGLQTFSTRAVSPATDPPTFQVVQTPVGNATPGVGMIFDGITYSSQFENGTKNPSLWGVARRSNGTGQFQPIIGGTNNDQAVGISADRGIAKNILYRLSSTGNNVGQAINPAGVSRSGVRQALGAGTNTVEFGYFVKESGSGGGDSPIRDWVDADGIVTGLASLQVAGGYRYYAVTDEGELMSLLITADSNSQRWSDQYTVVLDENNAPIKFTGLTAGPTSLNDGFNYSNMLFATASNGRMYAMNTSGVLQPIFVGGSSFTTVDNTIRGISFSPLDSNLWHLSQHNSGEAGHGRVGNFNGSSDSHSGTNNSFRFGYADPNANVGMPQGNHSGIYDVSSRYNTIAAPGGARGAIESKVIDLSDYSANDQPMLYFNYRLETQNSNSQLGDNQPALDAFRVYASTEDGQWILLATNNATENNTTRQDFGAAAGSNTSDEFDNNNTGLVARNVDQFGRKITTTELFDSNNWRQARVSLAALAGMKNVKIRFEFSTGGDFRTITTSGANIIADATRSGIEFTAVPAQDLWEFRKQSNAATGFSYLGQTFEFDFGLMLDIPGGNEISEGDSITINGDTFLFSNTPGALRIPFWSSMSPQQAAVQVQTVLQAAGYNVTVDFSEPHVLNVTRPGGLLPVSAGGVYSVSGLPNAVIAEVPGVVVGRQTIPVSINFSATQVREAVREALALRLNVPGQEGNIEAYRVRGDTILLHSGSNQSVNNFSGMLLSAGRVGDRFGALDGSGGNARLYRASFAAQQNAFSGVQIDDIIIGFAERGETVFNAPTNNSNFGATRFYEPIWLSGDLPANETETGKYQLEIRTAAEYLLNASNGPSTLARAFDTNDRLTPAVMLNFDSNGFFNPNQFADGITFQLSDGYNTATYEYDYLVGNSIAGNGVQPGNIAIKINSRMSLAQIVEATRNAINSTASQAIVKISASTGGEMRNAFGSVPNNSAKLYLHGKISGDSLDLIPSSLTGVTVVRYGEETAFGEDWGDSNRPREQGQFIVSSTIVRNSANYGVDVRAGDHDQSQWSTLTGNRPYPGAVRNLTQNTTTNLAPGVVLMNNVVYSNGSGSINISGDTDNASGLPPVTLARVLNNTLYGGGAGVGINIANGAMPYVFNNIVANFATGIQVAPNSMGTTAGGNIYKQNTTNTTAGFTQSFAENLTATDPLFLDPANGRFYLSPLSKAIDSSVASLESRADIEGVRAAIGLPRSSILAPNRDIFGLLRSDDPSVNTPSGMGQNVFIDRGAIDRVDFVGPQAIILGPLDNDAAGVDRDSTSTVLQINEGRYSHFDILLDESSGTGVDPSTVLESSVIITENGRRLIPGSDYLFGYSAGSRTVRLTPLAGIWREDSIYEVTLVNQATQRLDLPAGEDLADGTHLAFALNGTNYRIEFDNDGNATEGSIVIPFTDNSSKAELAGALKYVLDRQVFATAGVRTYAISGDTLLVTGLPSAGTTGDLPRTALTAIRDLAGNALVANRVNSLTQFTIAMPEVQFDFGDAIERAATGSPSGTLIIDNGARHAILPSDEPKLVLGKHVDSDDNGVVSVAADADDFDSLVTLSNGLPFEVSTEGPARLVVTSIGSLVGETLTLKDDLNNTVVFRFTTSNAALSNGEIAVNIQGLSTTTLVAQKLAQVIYDSGVNTGRIFGFLPRTSGNIVSLGGSAEHRIELSRSDVGIARELSGNVHLNVTATGLSDGQTLTIHDGSGNHSIFQFIDIAAASPTQLLDGNIAVRVRLTGPVDERASDEDVASAVRDAINARIQSGRLRMPEVVADGTRLTLHLDDEDGVTFNGFFNKDALPVTVSVYASNAGYLDAWVDWNQDNDFSDAGEQMLVSVPVVAGLNTFTYSTPASAVTGFTTARFRLSTTGGLAPTGFAIGGEVEDHIIEVLSGSPPVANNDPDTPSGEYRTLEDSVLTVNVANGVLKNDLPATGIWIHDADPFTPSLDAIVPPANGTLEFITETTGPNAGRSLGAFRYTPNRNFSGIDTFVYQVRNERMTANVPATVTIHVLPVNDAPVGVDDTIEIFEDNNDGLASPNTTVVWESSLFTANDIRGQHSDGAVAEDEASQNIKVIAASFVTTARPGETISVDPATGQITYKPGHHYNVDIDGPVIVRLTIQDDGVDGVIGSNELNNVDPTFVASPRTSTSLLTINITPVNDRPVFNLTTNIINEVEDPNPSGRIHNIIQNVATGPNGASDELADQEIVNFIVNIISDHPEPTSLFRVQPHIAGTGSNRQLVYELAPDVNWANTGGDLANTDNLGDIYFEIVAVDSGIDSPASNENRSLTQTVTLRIQPVNDAPHFDVPAEHVSSEDAGVVTVEDFVSNIRPGTTTSSDEFRDQTVSFRVVSYDANFFASAPTISPDGTLVYEVKPNLNRNYTNLVANPAVTPLLNPVIVVEAVDDGPTGGSNVSVSIQKSFTVNVTPVNDAPVAGDYNTTAVEDITKTVTQAELIALASVGPVDESVTEGQVSRVTRVDATSVKGGTVVTEVEEGTGRILSFQYTPPADYFGEDSITYTVTDNGDPELTSDATIVFNVASVNDAPRFTPGPNITVLEDAEAYSASWATDIAPGPQNEIDIEAQEVHFELTVTPPAHFPNFFAVAPSINPEDGVLTFTLAQDANGSAVIEVVLRDNGPSGGTNNHVNVSAVHLLTITADSVNDAPIFALSQSAIQHAEDATPELKSFNIITGIAPARSTAADELANETVTFEVTTNVSPDLFVVQPHIVGTGANRALEYQLAPDVNKYVANGDILFTITAIDSGDATTPPANVHRSEPQTVTLTVSEVNDLPVFDVASDTITISEDAPLQTLNGFYRNVMAGPETALDELTGDVAQNVEVTVSVHPDAVEYFTVLPTINANGDLMFHLRQDANSAFADYLGIPDLFDITITATDDGTDDGVSAPRSFSRVVRLNVTPVNDAPFFTITQTRVTSNEDQGLVEVANFAEQIRPAFTLSDGQLLAIDEQAQALEFIMTVGNQGLFTELPSIDSSGKLTYRTAPDQNGTAVVTARLIDNGPNSPAPNTNIGPIVTFTIVVNAINDAPEFTIPSQITVAEDAGVVSLSGFATNIQPGPSTALDENRQTLNFTLVSYDTNLFEIPPTLQVDGTLSFKTRLDVNSNTPGINRVVSFQLSDSGVQTPAPNTNQSLVRSFTLNITPVNDAPIPDVHEVTVTEDSAINLNAVDVLAGDAAGPADEVASGQQVRMTQVESTSQLGGTVTSVMEGGRVVSLRYTPPANATGVDYIRYVVTDNGSPEGSATGLIRVTITPMNDAPQFTAGPNLSLIEDAAPYSAEWATNILAGPPNASDEWSGPDAQEVTFILTPRTPSFFAVPPAINSDGVLTFQLAKDVNGEVVVEVVAEDNGPRGAGHSFRSPTHLLTIAVSAVNDPPGFELAGDIELAEDSGPYSSIFVTNITGAEGQNENPPTGQDETLGSVHFEVTNSNNAMFSVQPSIDANGRLTFTPAENAFGTVEVYVVGIDDGASTPPNSNRSAAKTFTISLVSTNDPPIAVNDRYTTDEDTAISISAPGILVNDRDVDLPEDEIKVVVPSTPLLSRLGAKVTLNEDGSFLYDPTEAQQIQRLLGNEEIVDTFTYSIVDNAGTRSNVGTVSITISGINDFPVANDDSFQISAEIATVLNVLENDTDVDSTIDVRTVEIGRLPSNGSVTVLSSGRIEFRPNANFTGTDSFTYKFRDAQGLLSNEATVDVYSSVQPVAANDSFSVQRGKTTVLDVLRNDYDPDPNGGINPESVRIAQQPAVGTATVAANGQISYTPPENFSGTTSFQYYVSDLSGQPSNVATVMIRVLGSAHQNPQNHLDVNADGFVSPIDILMIINDLNYRGARTLGDADPTPPYLDVNGNGSVEPLDALELINYINQRGNAGAGGEGEASKTLPHLTATKSINATVIDLKPEGEAFWTPIDVEILSSDRYRTLAEEKWAEIQSELLNNAIDESLVIESDFNYSDASNGSSIDEWFASLADDEEDGDDDDKNTALAGYWEAL